VGTEGYWGKISKGIRGGGKTWGHQEKHVGGKEKKKQQSVRWNKSEKPSYTNGPDERGNQKTEGGMMERGEGRCGLGLQWVSNKILRTKVDRKGVARSHQNN